MNVGKLSNKILRDFEYNFEKFLEPFGLQKSEFYVAIQRSKHSEEIIENTLQISLRF